MSSTANRAQAEIKDLFNAKASNWSAKYRANGPLTFRIAAFRDLLLARLPLKSKVLDLGCGTGAIASALASEGFQVTACDIAEEMIGTGRRLYGESNIEWCVLPADWSKLPFDVSSFDAIIASSVLEYLPDPDAVLAECQRALKAGGVLIATVPNLRTLTRQFERFARPAALLLSHIRGLKRLRRLHSYATYLKHSRNRVRPAEWRAIGVRARFFAVEVIKSSEPKSSLNLLVFSKAATEAEQ